MKEFIPFPAKELKQDDYVLFTTSYRMVRIGKVERVTAKRVMVLEVLKDTYGTRYMVDHNSIIRKAESRDEAVKAAGAVRTLSNVQFETEQRMLNQLAEYRREAARERLKLAGATIAETEG